jgi:hypothetical protein
MALFADGPLTTADALRSYESSVMEVASTEGIDLGAKLELAHAEIGTELLAFLVRQEEMRGARRELDGVVATEPLKQWESVHALALIYRDAYNSQLNDRHKGKWLEYARLAKAAGERLFEIGVGISRMPLHKAKAPVVTPAVDGGLAEGAYLVSVAWRNGLGEFGAWSDPVEVFVAPGGGFEVAMQGSEPSAVGYAVAASVPGEAMGLQESNAPLGFSWILGLGGLAQGSTALPVQTPDYFVTSRRSLFRG